MIAAVLVALVASGAGPQDLASALDDPVVLVIDGREVTRSHYAEWLLLARGELYTPEFARLWRLRRLGAEHAVRTDPLLLRDLAQQELRERIEGAFQGDRERWQAELAREGRTPDGLLAQRVLELEADQLLETLAEKTGVSTRELITRINDPFEFHSGALLQTDAAVTVMTVDGVALDRGAFLRWLLRAHGEQDARRMADTVRIERAAFEAEIAVAHDEVEERTRADLERVIEHEHHGDRDRWLRSLELTGRNEEQFMRELVVRKRLELMVEKLVLREREVPEEELRRAWEERHGENGTRIDLRWIRIDAASAEDLEAVRAEAQDLRRRILEGEDFATLAEKHSDDAGTRIRGGRPGKKFKLLHLPSPLIEPVRALGAGEVSEPLTDELAVWLFEVTAIEVTPFEEAREALLAELRTRRPTEVELAAKRMLLVRDAEVRVLPTMFAE